MSALAKIINVAKGLDSTFGFPATLYVINRNYFKPYGKMLSLKLDTKKQQISVTAHLKGETSPIQVNIDRYEISSKENDTATITVKEASSDREWVDAILKRVVTGKSIPLPEQYSKLIQELLE